MRPRGGVRREIPREPAALLRALRACRDRAVETRNEVGIGNPLYDAAGLLMKAIDVVAFILTGDREYFWSLGGGATAEQRARAAEWEAIERGETQWPDES